MLSIFFIGIALSMDAFSVAISFGILKINKIKFVLIPIIVGLMHFLMTLLGVFLGNQILMIFKFNPKLIISIILFVLSLIMYFDSKNSHKAKTITSFLSIFLFAFSVSLDSFSVGLALKGITNKYLFSSLIFCICSGTITYIGLIFGKYSLKILKERAPIFGSILLLIIAIVNFCQFLIS